MKNVITESILIINSKESIVNKSLENCKKNMLIAVS